MKSQGTQGGRYQSPAGPALPGPQFVIATCGIVATAAYLGAHWLRNPVVGLPSGVWVVGIAQAAGYAWAQRARRNARNSPVVLGRSPGSGDGDWTELDVGAALGRAGAAALEIGRSATKLLNVDESRVTEFENRFSDKMDRLPGPCSPIKIGIDASPELCQAVLGTDTAHPIPIQWVAVPTGRDCQSEMARLNLDAMIHQPGFGPARVVARENPGRDAAWYDWSAPRPLTFASLFPSRIDPSQITVDEIDPEDSGEVRILIALARAAAVLSRSPSRLTLADRLRGRRPLTGSVAPAIQPAQPPSDRCILDLADLLGGPHGLRISQARRAAARAVGAFLATTDSWVDLAVRRRGMDAALTVVGDEPEMTLRAAAVRLAACDDDTATGLLLRAESAIRASELAQITDHLAFLQSEVEHGLPSPMTLGRVAAGICLVCATSPADQLAYLRGDVMDDVRYSAWLVGRDQDRAVLEEIFRRLEQARRGGGEQTKAAA